MRYRLNVSDHDYEGWTVIDNETGLIVATTITEGVDTHTPDEKRFADYLIAVLNSNPPPRKEAR